MSRAERDGAILAGVMLVVMAALALLARGDAHVAAMLASFGATFVWVGLRKARAPASPRR